MIGKLRMYNYVKISDPDEPVTTDLVTTDPVTTDPVTTDVDTVTTDHVTTDTVTTDPMTTDTVTTDHVTTDTDPVTTKPRTGTTTSELPKTRNTSTLGAGISDSTSISGAGSESNLNGGGGMVGGAVGGVVAAILVVGVAIALVVFVMRRSKRNNPALSSATNDGNAWYVITLTMNVNFKPCIIGISKSVHSLNSPQQDNNTVGSVESEGTNFPTVTNESYSTSRLPLPSRGVYQQQDMQFSQNQAYVTSANVSMKPNESYGTTTPSMDSDLLYAHATVEGEHNTTHTSQHDTTMTSHTSQQSKEEDYDYIIQIL